MKANNPRGLYIHIPFCIRKCPYCDFLSYAPECLPASGGFCVPDPPQHTARKLVPDTFISSLACEIESCAASNPIQKLDSVFMGGGTPSLLMGEQFAAIMNAVRKSFVLTADCEISLEANPGSLSSARLAAYMDAGLNRISLGIQSFVEEELIILGRAHGIEENYAAIELIKKAGVNNFNLDLICGVPGQSLSSLESSVNLVLDAAPDHISAYILQVEEHTPMGGQLMRGSLALPDDEIAEAMYYQIMDALAGAGYRHYEISNYARPGKECRHNLKYWDAEEYLGVGPGAVSYVAGERRRNDTGLEDYLAGSLQYSKLEKMDHEQQAIDALILGLRLADGIDAKAFRTRWGWDPARRFAVEIQELEQAGLLSSGAGRLALTRNGYILSNQVFMAFLP